MLLLKIHRRAYGNYQLNLILLNQLFWEFFMNNYFILTIFKKSMLWIKIIILQGYNIQTGFYKNKLFLMNFIHGWNQVLERWNYKQCTYLERWKSTQKFDINDNSKVELFVLLERLNGIIYLEFIQNYLPNLENVLLKTRRNMWLMHDNAPPHFSVWVRENLNNIQIDT